MERFSRIALILIAVVAFGLTVDYFHVAQKERQLANAVAACGGSLGSIPFWPLGAEYRVTLPKVPDDEELSQLQIANTMHGTVGIAFQDVDIPKEDEARLQSRLHNCVLFVVRDGKVMRYLQKPGGRFLAGQHGP